MVGSGAEHPGTTRRRVPAACVGRARSRWRNGDRWPRLVPHHRRRDAPRRQPARDSARPSAGNCWESGVLPESFARDVVIPFSAQYETMTIKGTYPRVRYFLFVVYKDEIPSAIAGDLYDAQIAPDAGSVNPFVQPKTTTSRTRPAHRPINVNGTSRSWSRAKIRRLPETRSRFQ